MCGSAISDMKNTFLCRHGFFSFYFSVCLFRSTNTPIHICYSSTVVFAIDFLCMRAYNVLSSYITCYLMVLRDMAVLRYVIQVLLAATHAKNDEMMIRKELNRKRTHYGEMFFSLFRICTHIGRCRDEKEREREHFGTFHQLSNGARVGMIENENPNVLFLASMCVSV